ncbi:MAG: peptide/nickel transport system substrate-binding protein, partial [Chloroflexota bacterium]|nr:peptide/nickel transport system substrate-binding protein [Chloroflexota bacterium]
MRIVIFLATVAVMLASCGPQAPVSQAPPPAAGGSAQVAVSVPGKPLNMALPAEPAALGSKFSTGRSGLGEYAMLFAAPLARRDYQGNPTPILATEVPSLQRGTWKVLDDGRMETIFNLRPSAVWHDGVPLTADDVVFTWHAIMNPDLPATDRTPERSIETMEALDAHTVMIRWREIYIFANEYVLEPIPRHILEPLLEKDPQSFVNATYWSRDWVGLGPYKIAEWVPGSYLSGRAFDNYVLGAPKIQEIFVHFIPDANQAVARFLAGGLDLTLGSAIRVEEGVILKEQLEARGEGTIITRPEGGIRLADFQYREPLIPPARDVRIRQALYHAVDRALMNDTLQAGLVQPAHMVVAPGDPGYNAAEPIVTRYPYDLSRSAQLLAEAGWTKGADGLLRNATGDRFDLGIRVTEGTLNNKEAQVVSEFWRAVGVNTEIEQMSRSLQNDQEYRAKFPGVSFSSPSGPDV